MDAATMSRVEDWLQGIGLEPQPVADPNAQWHFRFDYPKGSGQSMSVVAPKANGRALVIATGILVSDNHLAAFGRLEDDDKRDFLWTLRRALNKIEVDFQAEGASGPLECPRRIQISVVRYDDGLSMDSFAYSVGAINKAKLSVIWTFQEHLDDNGQTPGQRFDFKRLGY